MKETKPWNRRRVIKVTLKIVAACLSLFLAAIYWVGYANVFHAHEHCIKNLGTELRIYSIDNGEKFPYHTNGFGDALVLCVKYREMTNLNHLRTYTAPDDDARRLLECVRTGAHLPEDACTRAYVQGLSETNDHSICLMFDRYPTPGGDHGRCPWKPLQREVCMLDGSMQKIPETDWPAFRAKQIELLLAAGISRATAEKLYAPFPRPRR